MENLEGYPSSKQKESLPQPQETVESFETAQGSVYEYDKTGHSSRFKTSTGEQMDPQDITVFVDLSLDQQQDVLSAYRTRDLTQKTKVYVVERQEDDSAKIIRNKEELKNPSDLYLAIFKDGVMAENMPASLFPKIGSNVFDTRHFKDGRQWMTERHLGNKVTKINYKDGSSEGDK